MKTLHAIVIGLSILAAMTTAAVPAQAKDHGKKIAQNILGSIARSYQGSSSKNGSYCLQPPHKHCPLPQPWPSYGYSSHYHVGCYYLGVWTTSVQLAPAYSSVAAAPAPAASGSAAIQVAPGAGQGAIGLRIDQIAFGSPAQRAGLEPGDILVMANGHSLHCKQQLRQVIRGSRGFLQLLVINGRTGQLVSLVAYPQLR